MFQFFTARFPARISTPFSASTAPGAATASAVDALPRGTGLLQREVGGLDERLVDRRRIALEGGLELAAPEDLSGAVHDAREDLRPAEVDPECDLTPRRERAISTSVCTGKDSLAP